MATATAITTTTVSPGGRPAFIDECCEVGGDLWIQKDQLYAAWRAWCEDRGDTPGNKATFGQSLVNAGCDIRAARKGTDGQRFQVYEGVRVCQ